MIPWLDEAQVVELLRLVQLRRTAPARRMLQCAGMRVPEAFNLLRRTWRAPFLRELERRLGDEDPEDDDSTTHLPDLTRFCADVRNVQALQELAERLAREEDVDIGAEFGWED
jgi:hypothetical protein